jgi:hypothetical protein
MVVTVVVVLSGVVIVVVVVEIEEDGADCGIGSSLGHHRFLKLSSALATFAENINRLKNIPIVAVNIIDKVPERRLTGFERADRYCADDMRVLHQNINPVPSDFETLRQFAVTVIPQYLKVTVLSGMALGVFIWAHDILLWV